MHRARPLVLLLVSLVSIGACGSSAGSTATPAASSAIARLDDAAAVVEDRLQAMGFAAAALHLQDGVLVLDGVPPDQRSRLIDVLRRPGVIEFVSVPANADPPSDGAAVPPAWPRLFGGEAIDHASATAGIDQAGLRTVDLTLTAAGAERFATWTRGHVGERFAIVADGIVLMAPVVNEEIVGGHVQISPASQGGSDADEAQILVALIRSGPLPAEFVAAGAPIR